MKPDILLVEDEKEIADTLNYALSTEGFSPTWVTNGQDALAALQEQEFALAVFDIGLPDANGIELLKSIRQSSTSYANLPCIFLTARSEEIDRIVGLEIGADDYVCKPFSPREVVARIKVILKRAQSSAIQAPTQPARPAFEHAVQKRQISYQNAILDLTKAEYELLSVFLEQSSYVYTRRELIERIWSSNHPSDDRAIDTHIKTLRAKLKTHNPHKDFIITHRGHGYSFAL